MNPKVSIIMGSTSDLPIMEQTAKLLDEFEIPFEINALSAHCFTGGLYCCKTRRDTGDSRQINEAINRTQQVILRYVIVNRELIKQCALRILLRSQHRNHPRLIGKLNQRPPVAAESFNRAAAARPLNPSSIYS